MALTWTSAQVTSLSRIFGTYSNNVSTRLAFMDSVLTAADQTAIIADIAAFELVESDNVDVDPNVKNFGARISASAKRALIKNRIAGLLQWETSDGGRLIRA